MLGLVCLAQSAAAPTRVLRLEEAEALARRHQPQLLQAAANVEIARAREVQARAPLLPQINATSLFLISKGTYARVGNSAAVPLSSGTDNGPLMVLSFGANVTQTLWDFGAIERYRASSRLVEAQRATARANWLTVLLTVRRAYFNAQAQHALVGVADETLADQTRHLEQIEEFVKAGLRTGIDLAQTRTAVANAQLQLINARANAQVARATLAQAIGAPDLENVRVADEQLAPLPEENDALDSLVELAFMQRPELDSLRKQADAQAQTILAARAGWVPSLSASGSFAEAGQTPTKLGPNWSASANLSWNLLAGGMTVGQTDEALATARSIQAQFEQVRLQARADVEIARAQLHAQLGAITAAQSALEAARAQRELAEGRYKEGVGSILELTDAEVQVTTAGVQLVQARLNVSTARAQLAAALGSMP